MTRTRYKIKETSTLKNIVPAAVQGDWLWLILHYTTERASNLMFKQCSHKTPMIANHQHYLVYYRKNILIAICLHLPFRHGFQSIKPNCLFFLNLVCESFASFPEYASSEALAMKKHSFKIPCSTEHIYLTFNFTPRGRFSM